MRIKITDELRKNYTTKMLQKGITRFDLAFIIGISGSYISASMKRGCISSNSLFLLEHFLSFTDLWTASLRKQPSETRDEFYNRKENQLVQIRNDFQKYLEQFN